MTDFSDGGASAPAESAPASAEPVTQTPNPVSTEREPSPPEPKTEPEAKEPKLVSTREALQKAADKVNAEDKSETAKPVKSDPQNRGDDGKFASKDGEGKPAPAAEAVKPAVETVEKPADAQQEQKAPDAAAKVQTSPGDAPARFSNDAKAAWAQAPEAVKAEVARMEREMSAGIEKYRGSAEKYESIRQFDEMAERGGNTLAKVIEAYVGLENLLETNTITAFERISQMKGFSFREVAERYLGQTPDQTAQAADREIIGLKQQIADLSRQLGGVTGTMQEQRNAATVSRVNEFASSKPRFEELSEAIAKEIGYGYSLEEAYERAERLNPAPVSTQPAPIPAQAPVPVAHTDKGQKSITGAPTPGSDPVKRQTSSSIREALVRAAAKAS